MQQLKEVSGIEDGPHRNRLIALVMDEMKIKEDVVYNHNSGQIVGFTNIGEANNEIMGITRAMATTSSSPRSAVTTIATHVMAFMVQGICSSLKFPLAHYPTKDLTGDQLYGMVWEVVEALEVAGFKVSNYK